MSSQRGASKQRIDGFLPGSSEELQPRGLLEKSWRWPEAKATRRIGKRANQREQPGLQTLESGLGAHNIRDELLRCKACGKLKIAPNDVKYSGVAAFLR